MPENHQYRHGLAVMRAQPLHIGHEKVIRDMLGNRKQKAAGYRSV